MKVQNIDETFFHEIMSKSKLQVPFSDVEDRVMKQIEINRLKKISISRDIKLSWIFFIVGSAFGIFISLILPNFKYNLMGVQLDRLTKPFQILFALLFVMQLNNLFDYYTTKRNAKTDLK